MSLGKAARDKQKRASVLLSLKQWRNTNTVEERRQQSSQCGFYRGAELLPPIVEQTCCYLEQYGKHMHSPPYTSSVWPLVKPRLPLARRSCNPTALQSEGIFRISGAQEDVRILKDRYNKGELYCPQQQVPSEERRGLIFGCLLVLDRQEGCSDQGDERQHSSGSA